MKNPFLKYLFTCKHCGEESQCRLDYYSKKKIFETIRKSSIEQRCMKCGHQDNYHLDRLYVKIQVWPMIIVWGAAIATSYFWGMSMYKKFGLDGHDFDKKIEVIVAAFIIPLALGGFIVVQLWRLDSRFNQPLRHQRL